jgi:hypothetical protein
MSLATELLEENEAVRQSEIMRFTLYYDGPLPSAANNGRTKVKHHVRKKLHPQLLQLFRDHPALPKPARAEHYGGIGEGHKPELLDWASWDKWEWPTFFWLDQLCSRYQQWEEQLTVVPVGDLHFVPLIRSSLDLVCELDILFLRPGRPGLMERGIRYDIDNRLLTLFDALTVPIGDEAQNWAIADQSLTRTSPIFTLLGDDSRITAINVRTDSLLQSVDGAHRDDVRLVIGVIVRGIKASWANHGIAE